MFEILYEKERITNIMGNTESSTRNDRPSAPVDSGRKVASKKEKDAASKVSRGILSGDPSYGVSRNPDYFGGKIHKTYGTSIDAKIGKHAVTKQMRDDVEKASKESQALISAIESQRYREKDI